MDRRSFLRAATLAPVLVAGAVAAVENSGRITRVSCVPGDPGERAYAMLCGDGRKILVTLDGVEQTQARTADIVEGFVLRGVTTPKGHLAINHVTGEIMDETLYGRVEIKIDDKPLSGWHEWRLAEDGSLRDRRAV